MSQEEQKDLEKQGSEQQKEEGCQHQKQSLNDFLAKLEINKTQKNKEVVQDFINELKGEHKAVFEKRFGNETQVHPNQKYIDEAMIQIDNQSNFSIALKYISMNYFQHDEAFNSQGFTCLHMAVWKGKTDIMLHLLDNLKIDVNLKAKTDQTPLHLAIMRGNVLHFKMLLDRGANIESEDLSKITPIICAAQFNRIDMVIILKHYGAYMKACDINNCSIVHWAAYKNHLGLLKLLHKFQLPLNEKDSLGFTPLHRAGSSDASDTCKYLILHSPESLTIKDANDRFAYKMCEDYGTRNTIKILGNPDKYRKAPKLNSCGNEFYKNQFLFLTAALYMAYYLFISMQSELFTLNIIFHITLVTSLFLFFTLRRCQETQKGEVEHLEKFIIDAFNEEKFNQFPHLDQICYDCMVIRPNRTHHCDLCKMCVAMNDMHSPLGNICIGKQNRKQYFAFLAFTMFTYLFYLYIIYDIYWPSDQQYLVSRMGFFVAKMSYNYI